VKGFVNCPSLVWIFPSTAPTYGGLTSTTLSAPGNMFRCSDHVFQHHWMTEYKGKQKAIYLRLEDLKLSIDLGLTKICDWHCGFASGILFGLIDANFWSRYITFFLPAQLPAVPIVATFASVSTPLCKTEHSFKIGNRYKQVGRTTFWDSEYKGWMTSIIESYHIGEPAGARQLLQVVWVHNTRNLYNLRPPHPKSLW
jgi:hypothetical protein